jgi:ribosome biogenesis protein UTP30
LSNPERWPCTGLFLPIVHQELHWTTKEALLVARRFVPFLGLLSMKRSREARDCADIPRNRLNGAAVTRAVDALLKFEEASHSNTDDLFEAGEKVLLQIALKKVPGKSSPKPIPIAVPYPVLSDETDICLFVKKDDKPALKEMLMEDAKTRVPGIKKIITLDKLRTSYKQFAHKRELIAAYDLFLADDRILPMLTKTLGKTFLGRKKQPIHVNVTRRSTLAQAIKKAQDATYMFISSGTCICICVGTTAMTADQIEANIGAAVPRAIANIPRKWKNVQSIQLKTTNSTALPILNKMPRVLNSEAD